MRCAELNTYLDVLKLTKCVWLSEDASGIVPKIEFDSKSNQMIGLVLPTDPNTGMPTAFTYLARNVDEIQANMQRKMSTLVYIVLAQPLKKNVPPFLLQIFGTDNSFTSHDVLLRWKHTINELKR